MAARRLSENAQLLRYPHSESLRRTFLYASFFGISNALHLIIFRQHRSCLLLRQAARSVRNGEKSAYVTGSRVLAIVGLMLLLLLCSSAPAFAHKVYVYAWVEGNTVFTESYFSGGVKVKDGLIQVFNPSGKKLLEGHTNSKGEYSFQIPEKRDLRIVVNASMGHRGEFVLKREDFGGTAAAEDKKEPAMSVQKTASKAPQEVDMAQLKRMVEQALDSRLRPIAHSIARLQEKKGPGLTEVVGGIGYIFGIMGLLLYFRSRKK